MNLRWFSALSGAKRDAQCYKRGPQAGLGVPLTFLQIVVLALVQGITEFLPVSSAGHLVLASDLAGWPDQTLKFDVALHVGTLFAVALYFWRDLWTVAKGTFRPPKRGPNPGRRLGFYLFVGTLPVLPAGALVELFAEDILRDPLIIAIATVVFGAILFLADRFGLTIRRVEHMTLQSALFIGIAQALAVIPGTSRSGITMTAARLVGFERAAAARFSLLLSIPAIVAAGAVSGYDLYKTGDLQLTQDAILGALLSFAVALASIWALLKLLQKTSFTPFVIYRLLLGAGILVWLYN